MEQAGFCQALIASFVFSDKKKDLTEIADQRFDKLHNFNSGAQMKRYLSMFLLLIAAFLAAKTLPVMNADPHKPSILIAVRKGADSAFKQDLIKLITAEYGEKRTINVKHFKKYRDLQKEQYDALVVIDMLKAWLWMNKGLKDVIKHGDHKKTVFFLSTGDPDWKWDRKDIKLVTSATTKKVQPMQVFLKLKKHLDPILQN